GILPTRAHNDFLHALATQGLPGAAAYLLLPAALALACLRAWRGRPADRPLVAALAAAAVAFFVQNLVGFAVASTAGLLAVLAGLAEATGPVREAELKSPGPGLAVAAGLAVLLVAASLARGETGGNAGRLGLTVAVVALAAVAALAAVRPELGRRSRPVPSS